MAKLNFKVFEDNAGGITMFVLDADGMPIWGHSGYEYTPENLLADIEELKKSDSVSGWDGNGSYDGLGFESWEDMLQDMYDEISNDEWIDLVADSNGIYPENMGNSAREAFAIDKEQVRNG